MAKRKEKNSKAPLNLFIVDDDKGLVRQDAALRIFDGKRQVFYSSTRLGGVKKTERGYELKIPDEFTGMKYELKKLGTKKVITGTVEASKAEISTEKKKV